MPSDTPAPDQPTPSEAREGDAPPASISAALAQAALTQLAEGVIVTDAAGRISFVIEAAAQLHGVGRLDVLPEHYAETYHLLTEDGEPYPPADLPLTRAVLHGETVVDARWRIRRPDGSEILAVGSARPVVGPDGRQVAAVLTLRDDSAREAAAMATQARDALAEQLREAFLQSPVSTVVYDAAGRPVAANPAFERLWGASLADVPAGYSALADPQLEAAGVLSLLRRAFGLDGARSADGAGEAVSLPAIRYDIARPAGHGRELWTQAHAYPVRDATGAVERVVLTHDDVTARRAAEAALQEATAALEGRNAQLQEQALELELANQTLQDNAAELEMQAEELRATAAALEARTEEAHVARRAADAERARAEGILEGMADAYFALDAGFRIVAVNPAMERGSGLSREAHLGRSFWETFPGAVGIAFEHHYRRVATERVAAHFTHDYSDGRLDLVVEVDAYPAADGGVAVFWRDITVRARAEPVLRASEERYRSLFERMDEGFCVIEVLDDDAGNTVDYRCLEANPAFVQQTGLGDAVGRTIRELAPTHETHWYETYGRVARTGEPIRFEAPAAALGRWYDVYAFRVGRPEDRRVAVLFTDRSAAKAAERERERLLAALATQRAPRRGVRAGAGRRHRAPRARGRRPGVRARQPALRRDDPGRPRTPRPSAPGRAAGGHADDGPRAPARA